ncbi:MAG: 23S rRNA (guanosine(2251)-2'-O)-methyltransferase RlmB [Acidimicrobiales bacterium]|nr:MAG: 23S rRNA (guanosine(2251)-2'-O)-methyltransferase RlmB [Acidimicrobiales bacterium]
MGPRQHRLHCGGRGTGPGPPLPRHGAPPRGGGGSPGECQGQAGRGPGSHGTHRGDGLLGGGLGRRGRSLSPRRQSGSSRGGPTPRRGVSGTPVSRGRPVGAPVSRGKPSGNLTSRSGSTAATPAPRSRAASNPLPRGRPPVGRRGASPSNRRSSPASPPPQGGSLGGEQVEGRRAVLELLAAGRRRTRDVWVAEGLDPAPILDEIGKRAAALRVPVREVARGRLDGAARTDAPQGVLAHADTLPEADLDDLCRTIDVAAPPFLVVLDGVTDPHNLGSVLRSAEVAGVTGVVLPRHRSAHVTPTVAKAAAGAVEYLPMAVVPGIPSALAVLARHGVWTVGLDASAPGSVFSLDLADRPVALVLGAEGRGLARLTRKRCDVTVSIPQLGSLGSLNVAAAGAVACFELARRRLEGLRVVGGEDGSDR